MERLLDKKIKNVKGHVKFDVYEDSLDNITNTIEHHNLVVNDSSKILARALANPFDARDTEFTYRTDSTRYTNAMGYYEVELPYRKCFLSTQDFVSDNFRDASDYGIDTGVTHIFRVDDQNIPIDSIHTGFAKNDTEEIILEEGKNVFVIDSRRGLVGFNFDVTQYKDYQLRLYVAENLILEMVEASDAVETLINWERSTVTNDQGIIVPDPDKPYTYGVDYKIGKIYFNTEDPVDNVEVSYRYSITSGINHMGIGDRPTGHTIGRPVVITSAHKFDKNLSNEYIGDRQPVRLPADYEIGAIREMHLNGSSVDSVSHRLEISSLNYPVYELLGVEDTNVEPDGNKYTILNYIPNASEIAALRDDPNNDYVWIHDHKNAIIEFSSLPLTHENNLVINYRLDDGVSVHFIADFPPGLPQPELNEHIEYIDAEPHKTNYDLEKIPSQIRELLEVTPVIEGEDEDGNPIEIDQESLNLEGPDAEAWIEDGKLIIIDMGEARLRVRYRYEQSTFDVYEVGLFDGNLPENSDMFSIAGIGPVTKQQNTGIRVTWTITFETFDH